MNDKFYLREEGNRIFMCCGKANCPSVEVDKDGLIKIKDDYGNSVKIKKEEAALLKDAVAQLQSNNEK